MTALLDLQNVSFQLPKMPLPILSDITCRIYPGDCVMLLGSNGSGKSSLMKLMRGEYAPTAGQIHLQQKNVQAWHPQEFSKSVACITQDPTHSLFLELSVFENCLLFETRHQKTTAMQNKKMKRNMVAQYLSAFHVNLSQHLDSPVSILSGGEKQALLLALLVQEPPQLLLLDEHTSALDPQQAKQLMACTQEVIQKYGIATIMITHNLEQALNFGDRIMALKAGKIVFEANAHQKSKLSKEDLLQYCY